MKILFMCVANSARSQLAEGLAKSIFGSQAKIESAGSSPKEINPFAIEALKEVGINITNHYSKTVKELPADFLTGLNYIITLCAEEVCPILPSKTAKKLHWPLPDPAKKDGTSDEVLAQFRLTRDEIQKRIFALKNDLGLY